MKSILIVSGAIVLVAAAFASTSAGSVPAGHSTVPASLVGTWGKTIGLDTWNKHGIGYEQPGHWGIKISARGVTSLLSPPGAPADVLTTMRTKVSGTMVAFGPTADGFCSGKATYSLKVTRRTLAFKLVKDGCAAREVLLTAGIFSRRT